MVPVRYLDKFDSFEAVIGNLILALLYLIPSIFYILTLQKNLLLVNVKNRKTGPYSVWLLLIPVFNIIYHFFVIRYIKESNELEFKDRNISYQGYYGYKIGLAFCILNVINYTMCFTVFSIIPGIICWIIYWIQIFELTRSIKSDIVKNIIR